jgi:hypothetical protein
MEKREFGRSPVNGTEDIDDDVAVVLLDCRFIFWPVCWGWRDMREENFMCIASAVFAACVCR